MREVIGVDRKGPEIHQDSRIGLALPRSGSVVVAVGQRVFRLSE